MDIEVNYKNKRRYKTAKYPEARYSPCGTTAFLPDSLGKLIRMNKVPVVAEKCAHKACLCY